MKTMSVKEAKEIGFKVFQWGSDSFVPVETPRELQNGVVDLICDQFDPQYEQPGATDGYFTQMVQDGRGRIGLPDTKYIVRAYYSADGGVEDWRFWLAVKIG